MKRLEEVLGDLGGVEAGEVVAWVEARWVRPDPAADGPRFRPVDVARLRLIRELRHELAIDAETVPVVLSLLDELYGARRRLAALAGALAEAPPEVRAGVFSRCRVLLSDPEEDGAAEPA